MKQHNNDNDELPFITLGAATRNVMRYLESKEQRPNDERETEPSKHVDRERERDRFIEAGLRKIERFEGRYLNNRPRR